MSGKPAMHDSDVRARMGCELKRTSAKTVEDARQRLTSTSGTRASFDFELIDDYANSRLSSVLAVPALVLILAVFASLWVSPFAAAACWLSSRGKSGTAWSASVVFPTPGGPHRIIECGLPDSNANLSGLPAAMR